MKSILPPAPCVSSPAHLPVHRKKTTRKAKFPPTYLHASRQNVSFARTDNAMSNPLIPYDMPIIYNKLSRKHPGKPEEGQKWYLYCKTVGMVDEAEVARQIADETTLNPKEAEMAISLLRKVILRNLLEGRMVRLGDWAYFYPTIQCEGAATEEEAVPARIRKLAMHVAYDQSFQQELDKATYISAQSLARKDGGEGK